MATVWPHYRGVANHVCACSCVADPYEGSGGWCSQCVYVCKSGWARTNRILTSYLHQETEFRVVGKPSELGAIDSGVYAAAVMMLAHTVSLLLVSFLFDIVF